jgi:hypothetical protein
MWSITGDLRIESADIKTMATDSTGTVCEIPEVSAPWSSNYLTKGGGAIRGFGEKFSDNGATGIRI